MLASLIAALASGETVAAVRRARRAAVAFALAAFAGLAGLGFLVAAAFIWASQRWGALETSLGFAGGFFVLALLILLIYKLGSGRRRRRASDVRRSELTTLGVATALAVLPTLLKGRAGLGIVAAPAIALAAYAIYRENTARKGPPTPPDAP